MFNELSIVCIGAKDCIVLGTKTVRLVVVTIFVVVMIAGTEVVVRIFVVDLVGRGKIAEVDGKAARRIAATIRTLTRCAVFICMLVHAMIHRCSYVSTSSYK